MQIETLLNYSDLHLKVLSNYYVKDWLRRKKITLDIASKISAEQIASLETIDQDQVDRTFKEIKSLELLEK